MFLIGMLLIFFVLAYLLITNNDRKAIYIFGLVSIAYFIFGYGVPVNEIRELISNVYVLELIRKMVIILIVFRVIEKFEDTVFIDDYSLILRSFFFRYETITLALFLIGILLSTGYLFIDFLLMVAIVRLLKVDEFMAYTIVTATLFFNGITNYQVINMDEVTYNSVQFAQANTHVSIVTVVTLTLIMLILYFSGYLVRRLEKDIILDKRVLLVILVSAIIGSLGINVLDATTIIRSMAVSSIIMLYLNDMNVRKQFSRFRSFPLAYSALLLFAFFMAITIGMFSLILFLILMFFVNAIVMNEQYQSNNISYERDETFKIVVIAISLMFINIILANNSTYNTVEIGVPFIVHNLNIIYDSMPNVFARTYELYTIAPYINLTHLYAVPETVSYASSLYLTFALPMLLVISIPMQLLITNATKYRSKTSVEVVSLTILIGLILVTIISYGLGV